METIKCAVCKRNAPISCVSAMVVDDTSQEMCACCALTTRNEVHGLKGVNFDGENARRMVNECRDYYRQTNQPLSRVERNIPN